MKDIKVALIGGAGFMGRAHSLGYSLASVLGDLNARVHKSVLVDVDPDAATRAAAELGWERASSDWRAVVADPDIDVIDIVTPPGLHREIALEAIAYGKHVFCEKPITNDLPSAIEMSDAAGRAGVTTQVGFNYRHISAISHIRNLIDSGRLGVPLHFRGEYLTDALFFIDDFGWRGSRASGGSGATGDIGSHLIDLAEYLLGPISRVSAVQRTKRRESPGDGWFDEQTRRADDRLDDAGAWIAEFENGAIGTFSIGFYSSGRKNALTFEIDASRGSVEFDWNARDKFAVSFIDDPEDRSGLTTVEATTAHPDVWYPVPGLGQGYLDGTAIQIRRFLNAVATGGTGAPDFASAVRVQRVVDAVEESARTGAWVDLRVPVEAR
jgi:predicted dehydrogenase